MTAQLAPTPIQKFFDNNGNPLFNGKLYSYVAGTSTPQATYTDSTMGTQNTNPVILNARGEANVWLDTILSYKLVLQDANGTQIWAVDNIPGNGVFGTVQNIAALRNVTGIGVSNYQAIIVDGYTTAGDGGGGTFWWNSTSTVADNGGTIIAPTGVGTGRWYRIITNYISFEMFGAKGDGATNDTSVINSALTYGAANSLRVISDGGKQYLIDGITISQTNSNVPPVLDLQNSTLLASTSATGFVIKFENPHSTSPGFIAQNIIVNANGHSTNAVNIHGSQGCVYSNIAAYNATAFGINIDGEPSYGVYYNTFIGLQSGESGSSNYGGYQEQSTNNSGGFYNASNTFINCRAQFNKYNGTPNRGCGWYINYASNTHVGCEAEDNDYYGVIWNHSINSLWTGGYTEHNAQMAATYGEGVGITVTNASWSSNVATLTIGSHCLDVGATITVSSVNPSGYNGTYVITAITSTTVSYALSSNPGTYVSGGNVLNTDYSFNLTTNAPAGICILPGRNVGTYLGTFTGGNIYLLLGNSSPLINTVTDTVSSFTITLTGMGSTTTGTVNYRISSKIVYVWITSAITGTSNAATMTGTGVPSSITPTTSKDIYPILEDNASIVNGFLSIGSNGTWTFGKAITGTGGFTTSGTKGIVQNTFSYTLD